MSSFESLEHFFIVNVGFSLKSIDPEKSQLRKLNEVRVYIIYLITCPLLWVVNAKKKEKTNVLDLPTAFRQFRDNKKILISHWIYSSTVDFAPFEFIDIYGYAN